MDWADIWALDGLGFGPSPVLTFVSIWDLVWNIVSLVLSTYYALFFEVGGLGRYVFLLDWWPRPLCGFA